MVYNNTYSIDIYMRNLGGTDENITLILYINDTKIGRTNITINSFEEKMVTFKLDINESFIGLLRIRAEVPPVVGEYIVEDNTLIKYAYGGMWIYMNDFEQPPYSEWSIMGDNPSWQWGSPTSGPSGAYSGTNCWATNLTGAYNDNENSRLYLLFGGMNAFNDTYVFASFYIWYDIEDMFDFAYFEISSDMAEWKILRPILGPTYDSCYYGDGWTGYNGVWERVIFNLSRYTWQTIYLALHMKSDPIINYNGIYMDNFGIFVAKLILHDVLVESLETPLVVEVSKTFTVNATIRNIGICDEQNINVSFLIDGEPIYTTIIDRLDSHSHISISTNIMVSDIGKKTITMYVEPVPGELSDENNNITKYFWSGIFLIDDFETPPNETMYVSGRNISWEWGIPLSGPGYAYSGSHCWATNQYGEYNSNENSRLILNLTGIYSNSQALFVSFHHWFNIEGYYDAAKFEVSTDGSKWWVIEPIRGPAYTATGFGYGWSYMSNGWVESLFNLTPYINSDNLYIAFHFISDMYVNYDGWYVDYLKIFVVSTLILSDIWMEPSNVTYDDDVDVYVKLFNYTDLAEATLKYYIDGSNFTTPLEYLEDLNAYHATIPKQRYNTTVSFYVFVKDILGYNISTPMMQYRVNDFTPPHIKELRYPEQALIHTDVAINISVVEPEYASGIDVVKIYYSYDLEEWNEDYMSYIGDSFYTYILEDTVEPYIYFKIFISDKAGNNISIFTQKIEVISIIIQSVAHAPSTPSYDEEVLVIAEVQNYTRVISHKLYYSIDQGPWRSKNMTYNGSHFMGRIPAACYGKKISYYLEFVDDRDWVLKSDKYYYVVGDAFPPEIVNITWAPKNPLIGEEISVNANIYESENASGIAEVLLSYSLDEEGWNNITMALIDGEYVAKIIVNQSKLYIRIIARDTAGNVATSDVYQINATSLLGGKTIIIAVILLIALASMVAIILFIRRRRRKRLLEEAI